jgi:hypothetical protein
MSFLSTFANDNIVYHKKKQLKHNQSNERKRQGNYLLPSGARAKLKAFALCRQGA